MGRHPPSVPRLHSHVVSAFVLPFADYIEDVEPLVNKFVSVPKDYGSLNCAAFIAGVIHGVLLASGFVRAEGRGACALLLPYSNSTIALSSRFSFCACLRPWHGLLNWTRLCAAAFLTITFISPDGTLCFVMHCPPPLDFVCGITRDGILRRGAARRRCRWPPSCRVGGACSPRTSTLSPRVMLTAALRHQLQQLRVPTARGHRLGGAVAVGGASRRSPSTLSSSTPRSWRGSGGLGDSGEADQCGSSLGIERGACFSFIAFVSVRLLGTSGVHTDIPLREGCPRGNMEAFCPRGGDRAVTVVPWRCDLPR